MTDMVGGQVKKHPDVRVGEAIVNATTVTASTNDVRRTQQPHRLTHHVLRDIDNYRQVTHTQLSRLQQRVKNRHTSRIPQQPEQFSRLDMRFPIRQPRPQRLKRQDRWLLTMRRATIKPDDHLTLLQLTSVHAADYICKHIQMSS